MAESPTLTTPDNGKGNTAESAESITIKEEEQGNRRLGIKEFIITLIIIILVWAGRKVFSIH